MLLEKIKMRMVAEKGRVFIDQENIHIHHHKVHKLWFHNLNGEFKTFMSYDSIIWVANLGLSLRGLKIYRYLKTIRKVIKTFLFRFFKSQFD